LCRGFDSLHHHEREAKVSLFCFVMSYYVYFLQSEKDGTTYVGMAKNVLTRLKEHNTGKSQFTKGHMPYRLVYQEGPFETLEARKREKYLKSTAGKNYLRKQGIKFE